MLKILIIPNYRGLENKLKYINIKKNLKTSSNWLILLN
jgi:hypothetical protein